MFFSFFPEHYCHLILTDEIIDSGRFNRLHSHQCTDLFWYIRCFALLWKQNWQCVHKFHIKVFEKASAFNRSRNRASGQTQRVRESLSVHGFVHLRVLHSKWRKFCILHSHCILTAQIMCSEARRHGEGLQIPNSHLRRNHQKKCGLQSEMAIRYLLNRLWGQSWPNG